MYMNCDKCAFKCIRKTFYHLHETCLVGQKYYFWNRKNILHIRIAESDLNPEKYPTFISKCPVWNWTNTKVKHEKYVIWMIGNVFVKYETYSTWNIRNTLQNLQEVYLKKNRNIQHIIYGKYSPWNQKFIEVKYENYMMWIIIYIDKDDEL